MQRVQHQWVAFTHKAAPYGQDAKDRGCNFLATAVLTVFLSPAFQCGPPSMLGNQPVGTLGSQCSPQVTTPVVITTGVIIIPGVCGDARGLW